MSTFASLLRHRKNTQKQFEVINNLKVFHNIFEFTPSKKNVLTTGTFDGVHFGHKKVLSQLTEEAKKINGEIFILNL